MSIIMRLRYGVETNGTILDIVTWQSIQTGFNKGYMRRKQLIFKQPQLFYNVETSEFSDSPFTWFTPEQLMEGADVEQFNKPKDMMEMLFNNDIQLAMSMSSFYPELMEVK
jgi:hypothetical protein